MAFLAHFVSGLRDRYEHTFDSWGRIREEWHCLQLVPTSWVVEECADLLGLAPPVADQYLLWRTLALQVPEPLLRWWAWRCVDVDRRFNPRPGPDTEETLARAWPLRWQAARAAAAEECRAPLDLSAFGGLVPLCEFDDELRIRPHPALGEVDPARFRQVLENALVWNLLPQADLLTEAETSRFAMRRDGLTRLRAEMQREDPNGRIGTLPEGLVSDRALRLILASRLATTVAPPGLWAEIGISTSAGSQSWRLPLAPFCWLPRDE